MTNNRSFANLPRIGLCIISVFFLVFIDRITKLYCNNNLSYGDNLNLLPFLDITLLYNYGAAFGLLSDQQSWQKYLLISIGVITSILIIAILYMQKKDKNIASIRLKFAAILLLSGTLGNVTDRITHGYVIDFISLHYNNFYFPVFNIADIMISMGFFIFIVNEFMLKNLNTYQK